MAASQQGIPVGMCVKEWLGVNTVIRWQMGWPWNEPP